MESVLDVPNRVPDVADPIKSHLGKVSGIMSQAPGTRHQAPAGKDPRSQEASLRGHATLTLNQSHGAAYRAGCPPLGTGCDLITPAS